jgi:branched-subunit amino acid aminotransferase/4-amino-4-deoxychorismate lyase
MESGAYICINGEFKRSDAPLILTSNRAFRYGDVLTECIHACSTEPQFLSIHHQRMLGNMRLLAMEIPSFFTENQLSNLINRLLNKNRIFGGAAVRLSVFREAGSDFIPDDHKISFLMECQKLEYKNYVLNNTGLSIDVCTGLIKTTGMLSAVRNANSLLYLMAGLQCKSRNLQGMLLLNESGRLVETTDSNIFLVSGNSLFTPGIEQGCIPGVMRSVMLEVAGKEGYKINDQSNLTPAALDDAEEIFLTNAIEGIRWVMAYKQRRYYKRVSKQLALRLNELAFPAQL